MSDLRVIRANCDDQTVAPQESSHDGLRYPRGIAGWWIGDCEVACNQCAGPASRRDGEHVPADAEVDHPGLYCDVCGDRLPTDILIYPSGRGADLHPANEGGSA